MAIGSFFKSVFLQMNSSYVFTTVLPGHEYLNISLWCTSVFLLNRAQFKGKHSEVYWASGGQTSQVMDISHLSLTQTAPRLVPWVIFPYYLSSSHRLALFRFCLSGCCSVLNHSGLCWLHQSLSDELVFIRLKMNQMRWIYGDVDCHFNKRSR